MPSQLGGQPRPPMVTKARPDLHEPPWATWITTVHNVVKATSQHDTTANRPTAGLYVGQFFFDDTLGQPVWVKSLNPTVWINAAGAPV